MSGSKKPKKSRVEDTTKHTSVHIGRTCATCHRDISKEVYIKCARCVGFDQCLECFSVGNEARLHLRTHPFLLMDKNSSAVIRQGWSAEEEIQLLNAIQVCGYGNWHEIAESVITKTASECENHFLQTYIESETAPFPPDFTLPPLETPKPPDFDTTPRESAPKMISSNKGITTPGEYAGWMPKRNEYETEYQNQAEEIIAGLDFVDGVDDMESIEKKLKRLRAYNDQLDERRIRRDFVLQWGLHEQEFKHFGDPSDAALSDTLLPLAQIIPKEELQKIFEALKEEWRVKEKMETLIRWRKHGIVTQDEGEMWDQMEQKISEDKVSPAYVDQWNKKVHSPEFRSTLDYQLLNEKETAFCVAIRISPQLFLKMKDLLMREFTFRGCLKKEEARKFVPGFEDLTETIYDYLNGSGLFLTFSDIPPECQHPTNHTLYSKE